MENHDKLFATVRGKNCEGEDFTEELEFSLLPPEEGSNYYGTGCYMAVEMSLSGRKLIDERYEKTKDIVFLAELFIRSWYGDNARSVTMRFSQEEE